MLSQATFNKVQTEINKLQKKDLDEIIDRLQKILSQLLQSNIESFERKAFALVFEGSGWDSQVASTLSELKTHLNALV